MRKATGILMACVALTFGAGTMAACKPEEPQVTEGAIYVTEAKSFWAGVGSGYLSFEYKEEPAEPVEGERYGYVFHVMVDSGDGYSSYMSGNWELEGEEDSYGTLTLTGYWDASIENPTMLDGAESGVAKEYEPTDGKYTIGVSIPSAGVLDFTLDPVANKVGEGETPEPEKPGPEEPDEPEKPSEGEVQLTLQSEPDGSGRSAQLLMYADGTFEIGLSYYAGMEYMPSVFGTWAQRADWSGIDLTITEDEADMVAEETLVVVIDASDVSNIGYALELTVNVPQAGGEMNFSLAKVEVSEEPEVDTETHYTVTFDFLNGTTVQVKTSTFEAEDGTKKQYIPAVSAPATYNGDAPYVLGKRFAGWDTSKEPVLVDGVSTTRFLLDVNSNSYYDVGAIEKDVMEVIEDMTVYARWVEPQWVETEEDLRNMKNDLSGWYILKNDITLTGEWMPVGAYYATYEYFSPSWWTYAFSGMLDGNGYSIKGLKISTLEPYGDTVHPTEGTGNGTTALFGSVCNAEITDLVIESPVIDIDDYSNAKHGYVAVVAAFAQQSPKIVNVHVVDAKIFIKTTDVNYIAVCAFVGGHWGGTVSRCSATGTIDVSVNFTEGYEGGSTNLYVGGISGEGYGWIDETSSEMDIRLTVNDARAELPPTTDPTTGMPVSVTNNVYMGSIGASTAYTDNVMAGGTVTLDYANVENTLVVAYLGGIGGIQRYGYLDYSEADTAIAVTSNGKEGNTLYVGSFLGGYDGITSIINLTGFNDLKVRESIDRGVTYTLDEKEQTVDFIGYAPKTPAEMMMATIIAQAMGIDLSPYVDADGNYTIYGTDRCERVIG